MGILRAEKHNCFIKFFNSRFYLAWLHLSKRPGQQKKCPTPEIFLKCIINQNRVYVNNSILLDGVLSMTGREIHQIDSQKNIGETRVD